MKLYNGPTSPFGRKVRVVALELGVTLEVQSIDVYSAEFLDALNPLRQIPTLQLDDGSALYDSDVIIDYLDSVSEQPTLVPAEDRHRLLTRVALCNGLMEAVLQRVMEQRRPESERSPAFVEKLEGRADRALAELESEAAEISAGDLCLDQITTACALEYVDFRYRRDWRADMPILAGWLARFAERPSMRATRPADPQ